ncbi:MFS transporter [Bacteroidetes/Chlorobi group bacterium Naka2016]|jgi:POT family proton-dependent oligopeptide transporter|nr:MAG: MFS transporter [Bacteroidetes/Chlorobi group bacterium Naka2016]
MFKNHPKGLVVAFFSNMGERFGFYTMMAVLVLFLQAKYNLSAESAGDIYSWFYFAIYALALVGGIIADFTSKYKTTVLFGLIIMLIGYVMIALPGMTLPVTVVGLFVIALGNGLFKGNLQAIVGQMYDDPKYSPLRDTAYMIFYMGINIGAFFAPFAATAIRNYILETKGFLHDASLPALCHSFLNGQLTDPVQLENLTKLAQKVSIGYNFTDLQTFAQNYIDAFSYGYNMAFGIAAIAMLISLVIYLSFKKFLPDKIKVEIQSKKENKVSIASKENLIPLASAIVVFAVVVLIFTYVLNNFSLGLAIALFLAFSTWILLASTKEEKPRVVTLLLVFLVVIFFWMSFHQNGLTLTFFARDYTVKEVGPINQMFFNLWHMLILIAAVAGLILTFILKKPIQKILSAVAFVVFGIWSYYLISNAPPTTPIEPEKFQAFNPLFIVILTFPIMGFFSWLRSKNMEPSTPRKIGIGMLIASTAFILMLIASVDLPAPKLIKDLTTWPRVGPHWLTASYLILTIAELFLSPMGLSFVSKVAPSRFQGLMQGGWLLATAVGNKLLFVGSFLWDRIELWEVWLVFVVCCFISAAFIFSIMKKLEKVTK